MACKSGGHVCVGDGPELPAELAARLGPRYDLHLELRDFGIIFSIRVESPNHINIEEDVAVIRYLRWVLRSKQRFRHRVVLLVDSKVALGAIAKGRSSSKPLNALVRRVAALCFAGCLVLHCVFIPTKHNPADWPSRGDRTTWPSALRKRMFKKDRFVACPGCGESPLNHPLHLPKRLRGRQGSFNTCCIGPGGCFAYDFDSRLWRDFFVWYAKHLHRSDTASPTASRIIHNLFGADSD